MSSHPNPFSVGTKSSKYTLSKRGLSKKHNKNTITLLDKNIVLNYPSDFVKYKQQQPLSKKSNKGLSCRKFNSTSLSGYNTFPKRSLSFVKNLILYVLLALFIIQNLIRLQIKKEIIL